MLCNTLKETLTRTTVVNGDYSNPGNNTDTNKKLKLLKLHNAKVTGAIAANTHSQQNFKKYVER